MAPAQAGGAVGDGGSAFARALAGGSAKQRDTALAALTRWLSSRRDVDETEMLKLWKGLFYAMWHADKAPVQAEVAERMAAVLDATQPEVALAYFRGCFTTLRRDWFVIDRLRLDKYMLLVRKVMEHLFARLQRNKWAAETVDAVAAFLEERVLLAQEREFALGLSLHVVDVYLASLATATSALADAPLLALLRPFATLLAQAGHPVLAARATSAVFAPLAAADAPLALPPSQLTLVGEMLFDTAARADTQGKHRQTMYDLAKAFKRAAKQARDADGADGGAAGGAMEGDGAPAPMPRGKQGTPHPGAKPKRAPDSAASQLPLSTGGSTNSGSGSKSGSDYKTPSGGSTGKRSRAESESDAGEEALATPAAALEGAFEHVWEEPAPADVAGGASSSGKKKKNKGGGATPVAAPAPAQQQPQRTPQHAAPAAATPYSQQQQQQRAAAKPAAATPATTPGGAKRVRWALGNIELYTPTGAPQTAAGRAALATSAPKPTLRHNTPLSARVAAAAAAAAAARGARQQGGAATPRSGGGGGSGNKGKQQQSQQQQRTPGGGGRAATPGSAPRPRAVDFF